MFRFQRNGTCSRGREAYVSGGFPMSTAWLAVTQRRVRFLAARWATMVDLQGRAILVGDIFARLFLLTGWSRCATNLGRRPAVDFGKDGVEPSQASESR